MEVKKQVTDLVAEVRGQGRFGPPRSFFQVVDAQLQTKVLLRQLLDLLQPRQYVRVCDFCDPTEVTSRGDRTCS